MCLHCLATYQNLLLSLLLLYFVFISFMVFMLIIFMSSCFSYHRFRIALLCIFGQPFHSPGRGGGGGSTEQNAYPSQATANNAALLSADADNAAPDRISDRDRDSQNQGL